MIVLGLGDLLICENCDKERSSHCFGKESGTFEPPKGMKARSKEAWKYLAGGKSFFVKEMEVYQIKF